MKKASILLLSIIFYLSSRANGGLLNTPPNKCHINPSGFNIELELPNPYIFTQSPCDCEDPPSPGLDPSTGNIKREISDLDVNGGVGEEPLKWIRYGNSRPETSSPNYGNGHNWNNSYQYTMTDADFDQILIKDPDGGSYSFSKTGPNLWEPSAFVGMRLFQDGNIFFLQKANGFRYRFEKIGPNYQLQDFRDSHQNIYTLTYDADRKLTRVTEPAGRYLQVNYAIVNGVKVCSGVVSSDGRSLQYNYDVVSDGTVGVRLKSVNYGDGTQAVYTYHQDAAGAQPNLEHAIDPRVNGNGVNMIYTYLPTSIGFVKEQKNGVTGEIMAALDASSVNKTVCYANGRKQVYNIPGVLPNSYKDGSGNQTQYVYGNAGGGYLNTKTDALGRVTTYNTRTIYGNPLEITYPDGSKQKWTRDDLDLVLTHTDELGRITTYTRDASHRVTHIDNPDGTFETFTYNGFGQVLDHRRRNGGVEHSVYGPAGLKTSFTDAIGNVTTYTYDVADRLQSVTDARGNVMQYEYNERGLLTKEINADLSFKTYTYDAFSNRTSVTDELGHIWTTIYDEFRRPKTMTDPLNRVTVYSYNLPGGVCGCTHENSKPTKIILPSGKIKEMEYDAEWRLIRETVGTGTADEASTFYEYDEVGNLVSMIDPRAKKWVIEYDIRDRKKSEIDPLGNKTEWTYDAVGNILTVKRPDGGITINVYDNMNRVKQTTDPKGQVTKVVYDANGNIVKLTDPKNNEYNFEYDLLDRKTKMIYPGGTFETFTYDPVSNLATYTNREGNIRTYTYDNRNRETNCAWNVSTPAITRSYDAAGKLLTMVSSVSALSYSYTNANELNSETQAVTGNAPKTISYAYNADGLRNTVTYPGGTMITYGYSNRNQVLSISTDGAPALAQYTYDLNGNRIKKVLDNGTNSPYTYDDVNRILSIDNKKGLASFARFDYGYDNVDRRKFVQRDNDKGDVFTYDGIDQVTDTKYEVTNPGGVPGVPGRTVNYGLDAAGNRTSVTDNGTPTNYSTNNLNQYTNVGAGLLTYTVNGNLQTFDGWTYTYDAQNRLTKAEKAAITVDFSYDPMNRCVKRTINGTSTFFYYDRWNLIDERNSGDVQIARYVHGSVIDEILTKVSAGNAVYYYNDAIGSVIRLTDNQGNVVEKYSYDAFGAPTIKDGNGNILATSAYSNRLMFTGREFIEQISLYDFRNRTYSAVLGKFLQTDPSSFAAGDMNLYRYVLNNPINLRDPLGLGRLGLEPLPPPGQFLDERIKNLTKNLTPFIGIGIAGLKLKKCLDAAEKAHMDCLKNAKCEAGIEACDQNFYINFSRCVGIYLVTASGISLAGRFLALFL